MQKVPGSSICRFENFPADLWKFMEILYGVLKCHKVNNVCVNIVTSIMSKQIPGTLDLPPTY